MGILQSMTTQYDNYTYINSQGVIVPDTSTVQEQVTQDLVNVFGQDLDTTPETVEGRFIQCLTDYRTNTLAINAQNANQINLRYATGRFLDAIGAFFGLDRISATSSRVLATVTGVENTVIPAGSQAKTTNGDIFYAENDITIGLTGSVTGYFLSLEKGQIPCSAHSLNKIVNAVLGWETIDNTASATEGTEQESDDDFRQRIEDARYKGISLLEAIKAKLVNVENVKSCFAYDNYTNQTITYDGVDIDAHSLVVIVDGGANQDIAEAIFKAKTGGTGYTAISGQSVTVNVVDGAFNVTYPVTFNRPEIKAFKISIQVKNISYEGSDLAGDIKAAIMNWADNKVEGVDGLKIGQNISSFEIAAAVSQQIPEIYVKDCKTAFIGGTLSTSELTITIAQIGEIEESNITVTVV